MIDLAEFGWPIDRLGGLLVALADRDPSRPDADERHRIAGAEPPRLPDDPAQGLDALGRWLEHHAGELGLELEPTQIELAELEAALPRLGPALVLVRTDAGERRVLLLEHGKREHKHLRVLGPDLAAHRVPIAELATRLAEPVVAPLRASCEAILDAAAVPERRRDKARAALLRRRAALAPIRGIWQLRLPPEAAIPRQLRAERVDRSLAITVLAHLAHHGLLLVAWWLIGRGVLQGRSELGWLLAWALVLLSIVPLRAVQNWHAGVAALRVGSVLKRRLLAGILALDPDELRSHGIGRLLALVIESEAVESLAISTGLLSVTALLDLALAGWVLTRSAGGGLLAALLLAWLVVVLLIGWRYTLRRLVWARARLTMTHALVERMVGYTTRLAQEPAERWHEREDADAAGYLARSSAMDRIGAALEVLGPRGWTLLAVVGLWPVLVVGSPTTTTLALAFGGVLLGQAAFASLSGGIGALADLLIAWREVGPLVAAAAKAEPARARHLRSEPARRDPTTPIIEARQLVFRHGRRERPVLRGVDLRIASGERLLLEGPSGGGKSTLAALLTGLRRPAAGLLLLDGLDHSSHGELGWRERVAAAPQFHENHVLTNTFAFNLLMGRRWPPRQEDLELATALCEQLGLGPLLERMPAGMQQNVGESGWQLSHGERSRLFLARALLSGAELVILDESLAALDPDNQALALECAWDRARTLLVIAHP